MLRLKMRLHETAELLKMNQQLEKSRRTSKSLANSHHDAVGVLLDQAIFIRKKGLTYRQGLGQSNQRLNKCLEGLY